jgi:hypothetical protein
MLDKPTSVEFIVNIQRAYQNKANELVELCMQELLRGVNLGAKCAKAT